MDSITVKNFRCFSAEQTARLAPLTLLLGENSSGKTSLAAMIRGLWDVAYGERLPDFKEPPYDLGSFDEIVHDSGAVRDKPNGFEAAFETMPYKAHQSDQHADFHNAAPYRLEVTFGPQWGVPVPTRKRISCGDTWVEQVVQNDGNISVTFGTTRGEWSSRSSDVESVVLRNGGLGVLPPFFQVFHFIWQERSAAKERGSAGGLSTMTGQDEQSIMDLIGHFDRFAWSASDSQAKRDR